MRRLLAPGGRQTYPGIRQLAGRSLPGVRYRRHLLWCYSLVWAKPPAGGSRARPAGLTG